MLIHVVLQPPVPSVLNKFVTNYIISKIINLLNSNRFVAQRITIVPIIFLGHQISALCTNEGANPHDHMRRLHLRTINTLPVPVILRKRLLIA